MGEYSEKTGDDKACNAFVPLHEALRDTRALLAEALMQVRTDAAYTLVAVDKATSDVFRSRSASQDDRNAAEAQFDRACVRFGALHGPISYIREVVPSHPVHIIERACRVCLGLDAEPAFMMDGETHNPWASVWQADLA